MSAEWYITERAGPKEGNQVSSDFVYNQTGWIPKGHPAFRKNNPYALTYTHHGGRADRLLHRNEAFEILDSGYQATWGGWGYKKDGVYYLTKTSNWTQATPSGSGSYVDSVTINFSVEDGFTQTFNPRTGTEPSYHPDAALASITVTYSDPLSGNQASDWATFAGAALTDDDYLSIGFFDRADGASGDGLNESRIKYRIKVRMSPDAALEYEGAVTAKWDEREVADTDDWGTQIGNSVDTYSEHIAEPRFADEGMSSALDIEAMPWVAPMRDFGYEFEFGDEFSDGADIAQVLSPADMMANSYNKRLPQVGSESSKQGVVFFGGGEVTVTLSITAIDYSTAESTETLTEIVVAAPTGGERIVDITSTIQAEYTSAEAALSGAEDIVGSEITLPSAAQAGFVAKHLRFRSRGFRGSDGNYYKVMEEVYDDWTVRKTLIDEPPKYGRDSWTQTITDNRIGTITPKSTSTFTIVDASTATTFVSGEYVLQAAANKHKRIENLRVQIGDREYGSGSKY